MSRWRIGVAGVVSIAALQAGCGPNSRCGDGILAPTEECDDGNTVLDDGCSFCTSDPGWACRGTVCDPICRDGITVDAEVCDPTDPPWEGYCSTDCMMIIGSCGDAIVQRSEACDDGVSGGGDGCTDACEEALGWTCPPAEPCDASSLDPDVRLGDLESDELTAFCIWLLAALGGPGTVHRCGGANYTVNSRATCEANFAAIAEGSAVCTVGDFERWTGERSDACDFFRSTEPICP